MTTALALFALTDLATPTVEACTRCGNNQPATTRVHAAPNLLGVVPAYLAPTRYRDLTPITSPACCDNCAWRLADSWWASSFVCPTGVCALWAHTLANPRPNADCTRHHNELRVVWRTPLEVTA